MKIVFLGTNGWYDTCTGNTICILIETKRAFIILDAGSGLYKIDSYIKTKKPIYLFLSHFHLDHVMGFHALAKFNFSQGINIYGPKGLKAFFKSVINRPYTIPISELKTRIRLFEINNKSIAIPVNVIYRKLRHSSVCFGYRFLLEKKVVSYCADTGLCRNLFLLAKNADLLIADCAFKAGQENDKWPHLNPRNAAKLAMDSQVKQLALVHFDASLYLTLKDRKDAEIQARRIFRQAFIYRDNQGIML